MRGWIIFTIAFLLYFVSVFGGFVQDDLKVIQGDPDMGKTSALVAVWTRPYYHMDLHEKSIYRPVTSFSFYLNSLITGNGAWGFRLWNVVIYAWVCWLVYRVLGELKESRTQKLKTGESESVRLSDDVAFWGAVVFAVLPIHTEVVNNVVGRSELMSLGFFMLAVLKNLEKKWDLSAVFWFLALLSKETAIVGLPVLGFLSMIGSEKKMRVPAIVMLLTALAGFMMLRIMALGGLGMGNGATMVENPLKHLPPNLRIINAISLIPFGLGKILFPVNLSYDYSFNQIKLINSWMDWRVMAGIGMMAMSCVYLYRSRIKLGMTSGDFQGQALKVVGMMLFWGPILLTGNILFPIGTIFGERLWFWSSLGFIMFAFSWFEPRQNRTRISLEYRVPACVRLLASASAPLVMVIMVSILYAGRTMARNIDWLSQERLFLHDGEYVTDSVLAQSNRAAMYLMRGDPEKGRIYMEKAESIYPKYPELLNNRGMYYLWTGNKERAKSKFEECLVERPEYYLCQRNLDQLEQKGR